MHGHLLIVLAAVAPLTSLGMVQTADPRSGANMPPAQRSFHEMLIDNLAAASAPSSRPSSILDHTDKRTPAIADKMLGETKPSDEPNAARAERVRAMFDEIVSTQQRPALDDVFDRLKPPRDKSVLDGLELIGVDDNRAPPQSGSIYDRIIDSRPSQSGSILASYVIDWNIVAMLLLGFSACLIIIGVARQPNQLVAVCRRLVTAWSASRKYRSPGAMLRAFGVVAALVLIYPPQYVVVQLANAQDREFYYGHMFLWTSQDAIIRAAVPNRDWYDRSIVLIDRTRLATALAAVACAAVALTALPRQVG